MKVNNNVLKLRFGIIISKALQFIFLDEEYVFSIGLNFILLKIVLAKNSYFWYFLILDR
jgi:hypothetical protein